MMSVPKIYRNVVILVEYLLTWQVETTLPKVDSTVFMS